MNNIKIIFLFVLLCIPLQLISQVHEEWDVRYRGANDNIVTSKIVKYDNYGNVYVLGDASSNSSLLLIKYNSRGELQWTSRKPNTYSVGMGLDNMGNIYVCGQISNNGGGIIIKYSSFGATQWEVLRPYYINDMVVDDFSNVYITGSGTDGILSGIQTVKYNSSGNLLWVQIFTAFPAHGSGYRIILDNAGNVYTLADYSYTGISSIKLIKYNNNGQLQWAGTASQNFDLDYYSFAGLGIDGYGSIYCGGTGWLQNNNKVKYIVTKFSTAGAEIWNRIYNSDDTLDYIPVDMEVTVKGDVYITGYAYVVPPPITKVTTIKYDSTGQLKWKKDYTNSNGHVFPGGMITDIFGNIYLSINNNNYGKITTLKYDSTGTQKWLIDYIGVSAQSVVKDIEADNYGNIYLCGNTSAVQFPECLTIRYLQSWNTNFNITGCVKYKDNAQPVESGYIKAVKLDRNNGNIVTVDSTPIQVTGYYSLKHIPQDSIYLIAFPTSNQSFEPSYYPQGIYWKNAQKIFTLSNLSEVNLNVERQLTSQGNCIIKGKILKAENRNVTNIKDALIYIKSGNNFFKNTTSDGNGTYEINNIQSGSIKVIVDRLGYSADSLSMTLISGNTYDNINFYLNQIYVNILHYGNNIPSAYSLYQNYPNPFNPTTKIKFDIAPLSRGVGEARGVSTQLKVYDITGREIQTLVNEKLNPGTYEVTFDGSGLSSGIYFYQLRAGDFVDTKKFVLLK